ncbi:MAG: DUF2959 family protein [Opitutaceae bacterium]|jgi:hypothetical protein
MKTSALVSASLLVAVTALGTVGCSSFRQSSAPDATKPVGGKAINLLQFRNDVQATRIAIARTSDALGRLPDSPNAQDAYASYSTELAALAKLIDRTSRESAEVRNHGKILFAQWEAEANSIKNPEIKAVADARRLKLQAAYQDMLTPLIDARANFTPLLSDFTDLQKALALDLTSPGIKAVQPLITKTIASATVTIKSLDTLAAELGKIVAVLPAPTVAPVN